LETRVPPPPFSSKIPTLKLEKTRGEKKSGLKKKNFFKKKKTKIPPPPAFWGPPNL